MSDEKLVHFHVFNPRKSVFKLAKNAKAEAFYVYCSNSKNCGLYKRGECSLRQVIGGLCEYGRCNSAIGYTARARCFTSWIEDKKKAAGENPPTLKAPTCRISVVGNYIYLPYSHISMNKAIPFDKHGGAFRTGSNFLAKEHWNIETIRKIISFRPQAMIGGEIISYQKEVIPDFLLHLKQEFPDLYGQLGREDKARTAAYVGKKALLKTLNPNSVFHKKNEAWHWDGEVLTSNNARMLFAIVEGIQTIKITPVADAAVVVECESQMNENTVFVD